MRGLCFQCNEKFTYGHKCKKLFNMEVEEVEEVEEENEEESDKAEPTDENAQVSLHALTGCLAPEIIKIIKVKGRVKKNEITVLIDTGSTRTFLHTLTARNLKCVVECTNSIMVTVADGSQIESNSKCPNFSWEMGKQNFCAEVRLLRLGGCDMVLGVDFLRRKGPITFDYEKLQTTLKEEGRDVVLQGQMRETTFKYCSKKGMQKMISKGKVLIGCLVMLTGSQR